LKEVNTTVRNGFNLDAKTDEVELNEDTQNEIIVQNDIFDINEIDLTDKKDSNYCHAKI